MPQILTRRRLALLLLMPLLATCTALPAPQARFGGSLNSASEDERLVTLLIDGPSGETR